MRAMTFSSSMLAFSSLSQNMPKVWENSKSSTSRRSIVAARATLKDENIQQRPEWRWLVTAPVRGRLTLKVSW